MDTIRINNMKRTFFVLFASFVSFTLTAQQEEQGWNVRSAALSVGASTYDDGGAFFGLDVDLGNDDHLIKAMGLFSAGLGIFGEGLETQEYDLMYGRELSIGKRSWLQFFAGLGYVRYERRPSAPGFESYFTDSLGFPLLARARYDVGSSLSLGLQGHANFNAGRDFYTLGFFLQFKFEK